MKKLLWLLVVAAVSGAVLIAIQNLFHITFPSTTAQYAYLLAAQVSGFILGAFAWSFWS